MQYRKATIDVYSGRCGAVHHFSLKDAHSKVASPECCTLESKYFWSCISILMPDLWFFLVSLLTIFEEISSKNCGGRHEHNYNKGFDPIVCTRNLDKISLQKSQYHLFRIFLKLLWKCNSLSNSSLNWGQLIIWCLFYGHAQMFTQYLCTRGVPKWKTKYVYNLLQFWCLPGNGMISKSNRIPKEKYILIFNNKTTSCPSELFVTLIFEDFNANLI